MKYAAPLLSWRTSSSRLACSSLPLSSLLLSGSGSCLIITADFSKGFDGVWK